MDFFIEVSLVIVAAAVVSGIMRLFKQPIIIGYVLTGIILGPQVLGVFHSTDQLAIFSQLGVAILLFIVGLHLSPKEAKDLGKTTFLIAAGQVVVTAVCAFALSQLLGFNIINSIYVGVALSFSSTIIVLKLLSDKRDLEKLYGRVTIGILLFQDIVAAVSLIFASTFTNTSSNGLVNFGLLIINGLLVSFALGLTSIYILPKLGSFFAKSQEYLFLFSLAWGFGLAALVNYLGFSIEIGALVAGVSLSFSPYSQEISSRLKPLRDFFIVMFFILLGSQISFTEFTSLFIPLLVLLAFILIIKPLIIVLFMNFAGYNKRTSLLTGISLSQISEFSLILIAAGLKMGQVSPEIVSLLTILSVLSIGISTYSIMYADKLVAFFSRFSFFPQRQCKLEDPDRYKTFSVILFGCNRAGYDFIKMFRDLKSDFLAVDFDPDIVKELNEKGIHCKYGDAEDIEFLDEIKVDESKITISTIPDFETNLFLLKKVRKTNHEAIVILISYNIDEALSLYDNGATYVILPHFIGGQFAAELAKDAGFDITKLHDKRLSHLAYLKERKALGHAHPLWAHNQR